MYEFKILKVVNYNEVPIKITTRLGVNDNRMYIPRDCIKDALSYKSSNQLSKMQSKYYNDFRDEYIRDFVLADDNGVTTKESGIYTIKGVLEVCSHTQKFRRADEFLKFLLKKVKELSEEEKMLISKAIETFNSANMAPVVDRKINTIDRKEMELLIKIDLSLTRIEEILLEILNKIN